LHNVYLLVFYTPTNFFIFWLKMAKVFKRKLKIDENNININTSEPGVINLEQVNNANRLGEEFFSKKCLNLSKHLLNKYLIRNLGISEYAIGKIVEVEAYPGAAVLIRALEPVHGLDKMRLHRSLDEAKSAKLLANGPSKLCIGMNIPRIYLTKSIWPARTIYGCRKRSRKRQRPQKTQR
jgi:3-methyladenine DNA glycosylase Mpg